MSGSKQAMSSTARYISVSTKLVFTMYVRPVQLPATSQNWAAARLPTAIFIYAPWHIMLHLYFSVLTDGIRW